MSSFKNNTPAKCGLGRLRESVVPQLTHVLFLRINTKPGPQGSESLGDLRRPWGLTLAAQLAVAWVPPLTACLAAPTTPGAGPPLCKTTLGQRIAGTRLREGDSSTGGYSIRGVQQGTGLTPRPATAPTTQVPQPRDFSFKIYSLQNNKDVDRLAPPGLRVKVRN